MFRRDFNNWGKFLYPCLLYSRSTNVVRVAVEIVSGNLNDFIKDFQSIEREFNEEIIKKLQGWLFMEGLGDFL